MRQVTLEELLSAGCHFGHQLTRQNPKARDFIFEARDNIHIIDLAKTKVGLEEAANFIKDLAANAGTLLVVGTKRQAKDIVLAEMKRLNDPNIFYVTSHWVGGTLTNFFEVSKNYKKLRDLENKLHSEEEKAKYTKKEVGLWERELAKLKNLYGGVSEMKKVPTALFVIDTHLEELAVKEAGAMGVSVVGIVDTNADPSLVEYPIPANDDAVGSIKLITSYIMDAWAEGKQVQKSKIKDKNEEGNEQEEQGKNIEKEKKVEEKDTKGKKIRLKEKEESGKRKPRTTKKTA